MNPRLNRLEKGFAIFGLIFFTGVLACDSLYISADPLGQVEVDNPLYRLLSPLQMLLYLITMGLLAVHWKSAIVAALRNKLIWTLAGLVLFSFLWSDFPEESLRKGINAVQTSFFGLYLAVRYDLKQILRMFGVALIIVALFTILFSLAMPGAAIETGINQGAWRGPFTQKNLMARLMVLTIMICLLGATDSRRRSYLLWFGVAVGSSLLLLSKSITGLIILCLLLLLIPLYKMIRWRGTLFIPAFCIVLLIAGGVVLTLVSNWENLLLALGRDPTMSGRTVLWNVLAHKISERPWLGYGFRGFWQVKGQATVVWQALLYRPPHAHNGYLNTAVDLGLVGLSLFVLSLAIAYRKAISWLKFHRTPIGLLPIMTVTFLVLYNFSESTMIEHNSIFWVAFVAIASSLKDYRVLQSETMIQPAEALG